MTEMFKLHGLSTTLTCIALLTFVYTALAFDAHRIDGINPKCEAVSAPLCRSITNDISVRNGRNRRSLSDRSINSNHNQESTARDSVRNKRRARIPPASSTFEWRYNSTTFPNFANDRAPDDVTESLRHLHPMIATECSKFAKLFLCSVHSPVCTEFGVVPPCRELCEKVLSDCARTIEAFGIDWPDSVRCSLFPPENPTDDVSNEAAFGERAMYEVEDSGTLIQRAVPLTWMEALVADGKICIPPSDDDVISPKLELLAKNILHRPKSSNNSAEHSKANHQYGLWCPAEMRSPPGQLGYSFLGMENCSPPCPNMYLSEGELAGIRYVIIVMSTLCIIVTLFTLCTFLIDRSRFRYPERPIVFYAFSYFMVSMTFTIGFILKDDAACNEEVREVETHDIIQGFTVVKGDHKQFCTILFMILYYFTVNGTIWWLILTVTWLLAAGFKWGSEAIEKYSMYYHSIAWGIPAVQTMLVVTFSKIEGDNISGVCFLGLYDSEGLRYMLLAPLCVYLFVGISILCAGFCCLNRVRIKLRNDEVNKKILAKFMLRIGVFSVLYIVPQVFLLVVYVIEDSHRTQWEASWFLKACDEYRVPCPAVGSNVIVTAGDGDDRPHVMLFCFKYVMTLIVALPPLFWVASKKTLLSWQIFFYRNNGWRSHVVTGNNNSNYFRPTTSSRKALLRDESITIPANDKSLSLGDGGVERDDVFTGFEGNNLLRGSSASVAALERAAVETDSRESAVLEHQIPDPNPPLPPPPLPQSGEAQVKIKTVFKKEFPEKRWDNLAASSASTSSRMTSSMLRHSSSTSSLRSDKRRLRRTNQRTSTLNRVEYEEKLTRDLGRGSPFVSADVPPLKSDIGLPTKKQTPPVPPPKPRRITLPMTSRGSASSHSNVDSVQREIHVAKSATVKVLPAATTGDTVEV